MRIIDNVNELLGDDLKSEMGKGSKLRIAATTFSIFAFESLKKELEGLGELDFIFTSPTFVAETSAQRPPKATAVLHLTRPAANRHYPGRSSRFGYATR